MALLVLLFALYFFVLTVLEIISSLRVQATIPEGGTIVNAFVLGTIMATYFKGIIAEKESYPFVASLIAVTFSILIFFAFFTSGSFSFAVFGIITFPYFLKKLREVNKVKN